MPQLTVESLGGDRHRIATRGHELVVDQPRDDGGDDLGPTPTELFVASIAACTAHYARRGLGAGGAGPTVRCHWVMSTAPPWRVTDIDLDVSVPAATSDARLAAVRRAIEHCTVRNSLADPPAVHVAANRVLEGRPAA